MLSQALFWYAQAAESACAPCRRLVIVGLMSDSFCVKPDHAADSDSDGP